MGIKIKKREKEYFSFSIPVYDKSQNALENTGLVLFICLKNVGGLKEETPHGMSQLL